MNECIFCKIVKGEIPCAKIWEDEKHLAFLDINPYCNGHTLIIPKKHSRWLWDIQDKDYVDLILKTKQIAEKLKKYFKTDWIEMVVAGMDVKHTHIHILPRKLSDGFTEIPKEPMKPKPSNEELNNLAKEIKG
jgi:histidine triad (HIT) family protein